MIHESNREQTVKELFDRFYQSLCVFASSFVKDDMAAADIVQESFVVFWERQEDLGNNLRNKSFLYLTVRNRCLNHLRDSKKRTVDLSHVETDRFFRNTLIEEEALRIFYAAVGELSPQMRQIIDLSLEGLKNAEIAERLGVAESTVHSTKKLAYKKLRASLKDYYYLILLPFPGLFS